ncbi:MAG: Uma2 family endonuclease [Spirulinaceae cyanobacterium]
MSFEEFVAWLPQDGRYELIDGNVFEMQPTGKHEVVSTNWETDYARKYEDYEVMGIAEYWIADYLGIGGKKYLGSPKRPTFSVCTLVDGEYQMQQFRGDEIIVSPTFPQLNLSAKQIFAAGEW